MKQIRVLVLKDFEQLYKSDWSQPLTDTEATKAVEQIQTLIQNGAKYLTLELEKVDNIAETVIIPGEVLSQCTLLIQTKDVA